MGLLGQASSARTIGELWYLHGPWGGAITRMQSSPTADVSGRAALNPWIQQKITTAHCSSVPGGTHAVLM